MRVKHLNIAERLEDDVGLVRVLGPEIPGLVVLIERHVTEDQNGRTFWHFCQIFFHPVQLRSAKSKASLAGVIDIACHFHTLLRAQFAAGPEIVQIAAVQGHDVRALVVKRVIRPGAPDHVLHVVLAHVQVPVVLSRQIMDLWLQPRDDFFKILELLQRAVGDCIAKIHHKIGRRVHRIDLLDGRLQPDFHRAVFLAHGVAVSEDGESEIFKGRTCKSRTRKQHGRQGRCRQGGTRKAKRLDETPAAPAGGQRISAAVVHQAFAGKTGRENRSIRGRIQVFLVYSFHGNLPPLIPE